MSRMLALLSVPGPQGCALSSTQSFANTEYAMNGGLSPRDATLSLNDAGSLRRAIVADTHSHPHPKVAAWIGELAPDAILDAGDIGDLEVLDPPHGPEASRRLAGELIGALGRLLAALATPCPPVCKF